ncbi:abnormal cell migration protein 10 isoform X1 [Metopolophium dirhodum]|uniref:abnormal cell migration protein 10 isoform X1 n=1 Tax=Metopolophium dirhodum TaxID=44670 RepID=UPI00298F4190|nr:abnormal cell migration protein 10 isoform X1 [Metopolophium dirhodum]
MFSCKTRYACGRSQQQHSDSDEDGSYGFGTVGNKTRAAVTAVGRGQSSSSSSYSDEGDYHIYGNLTFGYKPILKTRLSSAASSVRRRAPVKRTVSFSGVHRSPPSPPSPMRRRSSFRPPPPCYSVAVRRASSFSTTRRNVAQMIAQRQRMPLPGEHVFTPPLPRPNERVFPSPPSNQRVFTLPPSLPDERRVIVNGEIVPQTILHTSRVVVDVHKTTDRSETPLTVIEPTSLDKSPSKPIDNVILKAPNATDIAGQRMDSYRFSMANLEDTQDVDLDAVLGELCALESQYQSTNSLLDSEKIDYNSINRMLSNSNQTGTVRTDSPDNDSAFSDCVSLLSSSESSASSGTTNHSAGNKESSKAEKIRLALQKMKEASVKKLFIKVFNDDGGAKSLLVDEGMRCSYVMRLLADKHHINLGPRWGLVEHLPDLHMERVYEEHELLVDNLMLWTRDSKNRLLFVERPERTLIFENPSLFNTSNQSLNHATSNFAQEYFCNGGLPSVEGPLYIKTDSRKGWKKYHSVLRASGLYYYKDKTSRSPKDLVCLATFDVNQVYYGVGWRKKYKAPTEHCFAIKHPCLQQPKSTKYIKYVCAEDERTLQKWMSAIRIVKYGQQLLDNYESALAGGDSGDLSQTSSMSPAPPSSSGTSLRRDGSMVRGTAGRGSVGLDDDVAATAAAMMLDDTESGLSSDSGGSSSGCDVAFESDYPPCGTIKRKPPKLPLTATTRQLTCSVTETSAATAFAAATAAANQQKPVKSVKFADHHQQPYQHHQQLQYQQYQQQHHQQQYHHHMQHRRTPSLESLPPPPPELLVDHDGDVDHDDDDELINAVPPPPPKLLSPPSTAFLADLHRVVCKKWQVAQKCKLDTMATPHEVLGFRDPAHGLQVQFTDSGAAGTNNAYSREANVSNWVAEHYGPNNLYENVYPKQHPGPATCSSPPPPPPPQQLAAQHLRSTNKINKRPPPPPPPRSEKTQLTTVVS